MGRSITIPTCPWWPLHAPLARNSGVRNTSRIYRSNGETTRNVQQGSNIFHVTMHFRAHQTHYEQLGQMKIDLSLEGSEVMRWDVASFRDHSYGKNITSLFLNSLSNYISAIVFIRHETRLETHAPLRVSPHFLAQRLESCGRCRIAASYLLKV